jgi:hypothetical protein
LVATPPTATDLQMWEQLLPHMPHGLTRAVEYPLQGNDLQWLTAVHVDRLATLGQRNGS